LLSSPGTVERGAVRIIPALVVATGLVISLAACSSSPADQLAACSPAVAEGTSSALIEATGSGEPTVDFPTPLVSRKMERSISSVGDGELLRAGDIAEIQLSQFDGADATLIASTWEQATAAVSGVGADKGLIGELLECTPVGSRIVATVPASLFSDGAADDDTAVLAIDVVSGFPGKASGVAQQQQNGLPSIVTAPDGRPGFTIPSEPAPTKLRTELLQAGSGATIAVGDSVYLQFTGVSWTAKTVDTSTWEVGTPLNTTIDGNDVLDEATGLSLLGAAKEQLVDQKVGSQVLIVVPTDGDAIVYVVDILAIK
jgi:hypothetical protein